MNTSAIEAVQPLALPALSAASLTPFESQQTSFSDWLVNGITNVDRTLTQANQAVEAFALDGSTPPHQVMMALEEARMSLQFALQVRARLVEGYQELMRMQL